jgi:hypothetical protein
MLDALVRSVLAQPDLTKAQQFFEQDFALNVYHPLDLDHTLEVF